jgi:predicted Rossmann-fold nucleotide-binding protein
MPRASSAACLPAATARSSTAAATSDVHNKPCALLNARGFNDPLLAFLDQAVARGFLHPEHRDMVLVDDDPARVLGRLEQYRPPAISKWLDRDRT